MGIIEYISLSVGIIGTATAIYQTAVINESKKRNSELQFLLAGISNSALTKSQAWANQLSTISQPTTNEQMDILRAYLRARDDLNEIHGIVTALEGAIDSESSAITSILEKTIKQGELNNRIQQIAIDNPLNKQHIDTSNNQNENAP